MARDYNAIINSAKREAIAEGRAEGREEEKIEIAKTAIGMGMSVSDVAKLT